MGLKERKVEKKLNEQKASCGTACIDTLPLIHFGVNLFFYF